MVLDRLLRWGALALLACAAAVPLSAQQPELTGRVLAPDSTPIPHATVRATAADGREQGAATDAAGRYRLALPGGAGDYAVQASAFGYLPFTAAVRVEPGTAGATRSFRLSARPVALAPLTVVAAAPVQPERGTPAERAERWDSFLAHVYPVDPGSFGEVGSMVPGVVRGAEGLSMAGQAPGQNGTTVDGAIYGGGGLPSEGVRSVGVLGTVYDVSRGQFSGGQIAATTISGTNLWGAAVTAQTDGLASGDGRSAGLEGRSGRRHRASLGVGGPLVRDRLFVYAAFDGSRSDAELPALDRLGASALRDLPLAEDSVTRFAGIVRAVGASPSSSSSFPERSSRSYSGLLRMDWAMPRHGTLTARLDARGFGMDGLGASPYRLSGGTERASSRDAGWMLQHAVTRGGTANTLRAYRSSGRTRTGDADGLPAGVVRVSSELEDGTRGISFLSLGGIEGMPGDGRAVLEISDELQHATGNGHRLRAGFVVQRERASREAFASAGTFTFNSLEDLEAGRAASFTRVLDGAAGEASRGWYAAYLGDTWEVENGPWLVYGVRVEGTRYGARPALDPRTAPLVDGDAARVPADFVVTPRFGFRHGVGAWAIEGGMGGFAGVPALGPLAARWSDAGAESRVLSCVGPAAPVADWERYAADPAAVPDACADGSPVFASAAPSATVFDGDYRGARTWRASLAAQRSLSPRSGVRLDALVVHGTGLATASELNLRASPAFVLAGEGGRPVFAEPGQIDPVFGGIAPGAARVLPELGAVEALGSRGRSWTAQASADYVGIVGRRTQTSVRYTFTRSRLLAGGIVAPGAALAGTAGDPGRLEWMDAPYTPRHHLSLILTGTVVPRLRWSAIGTLQSGRPFTPFVGG
jgi:Carboxypeptidase regulatory-like domain